MAKLHLKLVAPSRKRAVTPTRRPNAELRTREHLTETEIEKLLKAAGTNRWGHRDGTMILVAYRHGLRAKLVDLRWDQINFATATLHVRRVKQGTPATHSILGDELRALRRLQREQEPKSAFVFTSERSSPFSTAGFARMVERAGLPPLSEPSPRNNAPAARAANRRPLPATKSPAQPAGLIAKKCVTRRVHQVPAEPFPSIRRRKVRRTTE
jgi:integrase